MPFSLLFLTVTVITTLKNLNIYMNAICLCDSCQGNNQAEHICSHPNISRSRVPASILGSGRKKASINSIRLSCKINYILLFILLSLPPQKWNIFCFQGSMITMSQLLKSLFFKLQTSSEEEIHQVYVRYVRQTPQS